MLAVTPQDYTVVTPTVVDETGKVWAIVRSNTGGNWACCSGAVDTTVADVALLLYYGRLIYVQNTTGDWYVRLRTGWTSVAADPRGLSVPNTPTQAPTAPTRAGSLRQPWDQPFAANSPWNLPIGSNAQWSTTTDQATAQLVKARGHVNCVQWSIPHYVGKATDPLVTITCTDSFYPISPQRVHVPIDAVPALPLASSGPTDAHMAFFDQTQPSWMFSYWGCSLDNGHDVTGGITCGLGGIYDTREQGITTPSAIGYGDYNFAIGTVRDWELGAGQIRHMLRCAGNWELLKAPSKTGEPVVDWLVVPWPNRHSDWFGDAWYKGNLPYGSTMGIPASVDLTTLGLRPGGLMTARALQQFGSMVRDSTGSHQPDALTFYFEPLCSVNHPQLISDVRSDINKIIPLLRIMLNQGPNSINGGGTPLVALPPPLDKAVPSKP